MTAVSKFVRETVRECYWKDDVNCATTMLRVLAGSCSIALHPQVLAAATGMHGAGRYGAQCGLVEGMFMFLGVWGRESGRSEEDISRACRTVAQEFECRFGSLACRVLRPQGFAPEQPAHMCEELTLAVAAWANERIAGFFSAKGAADS